MTNSISFLLNPFLFIPIIFTPLIKALDPSLGLATEKGIISIVGGGDSASALRKYDIREKITHLSTGGGASLELLSGNPLPATYALEL